ncbi:hypothetical protein C5F47_04235 [Nitrosopumilus cobalaminigenes]|uniref:Uncharacterized protein n=1 Tax=Nitrosopumilus cobalaminigenes TaxID=1470066 RepID=A0A7D5QXE7_9ARCH|nr:hypothetical protein [Nitrosopumilus cobalaminigenes]QLH02816.1 hypothetical protein C5F47_04235 [Nitrosopumilus cobalaminigenes]
MDLNGKFQNKLRCICNENIVFEIIEDIECDWGSHFVVQCSKCEELFSADCECPAFSNILSLLENNPLLYSDTEKSEYLTNSHPK